MFFNTLRIRTLQRDPVRNTGRIAQHNPVRARCIAQDPAPAGIHCTMYRHSPPVGGAPQVIRCEKKVKPEKK